MFNGLTNIGKEYIAKCLAENKPITFTKVKIGDGLLDLDENAELLTDVKSLKKEVEILDKTQEGELTTLTILLDNSDIEVGYYPREIGIYVTDDGIEKLYWYINDGLETQWLCAANKYPIKFKQIINLMTTNLESVIVNWSGKDLFVDREFVEEKIKEKVRTFEIPTIAELQSRKNLKVGDIVEILGYYSAGDGAGHKRIISNEDDGSGVQLTNELWANIVHNDEVNVSWFGAKGDGITDDSDVLNKIIEYCKNNNTNDIKFNSNKFYLLNKTIYINDLRSDFKQKRLTFDMNTKDYREGCIVANTGAEVFKFTNCNCVDINLCVLSTKHSDYNSINFVIPENERKGCSIVFSTGRKNKNGVEGSAHTFNFNIACYLEDNPSINKGLGTIAIYNDTCEVSNYNLKNGVANTWCVLTRNDYLGKYPENTYKMSCKDHWITSTIVGIYKNGQVFFIDDIDNFYFNGYAYGSSSKNEDNSSFIYLHGSLQNFYIQTDIEHISSCVKGRNLNYGELKVIGINIYSLLKVKQLLNVNITENTYFIKSANTIYEPYDNSDSYVRNINLYLGHISPERPKKIISATKQTNFNVFSPNIEIDYTEVIKYLENETTKEKSAIKIHTDRGIYDEKNRVLFQYHHGSPIGDFQSKAPGSLFINSSANSSIDGGGILYYYRGNGKYSTIGQQGYRTIADANVTTPNFIGELAIENGKLIIATGINRGEWSNRPTPADLNTLYHEEKMKQEGIYNDFISYMDEKTLYNKQQRNLEKERQLAYQEALKENPNLTYEEFMSLQPMTLNLIEEPQPSARLQEFMDKYL